VTVHKKSTADPTGSPDSARLTHDQLMKELLVERFGTVVHEWHAPRAAEPDRLPALRLVKGGPRRGQRPQREAG
jgi:hypothetical protein